MINFTCVFVINLLDFIILKKYFFCFSRERFSTKYIQKLIWILCVSLLSLINLVGNPNLNLIFTCITIVIYSLTYRYPLPYRVLLIVLYIGIGIVTEPIGLLLIRCLDGVFSQFVGYYLSTFLCEIIRFFIICLICKFRTVQWYGMSFETGIFFFLIPISSIIITCLTVNLAGYYETILANVLCISIIFLVFFTNILTFATFAKLASLVASDYQKELLIQEVKSKEMYYKQIEESNKKVRMIKHDLKNKMITIMSSKNQSIILEEIKKIIGELDESDKNIYTKNVIVNTILNNKVSLAQKKNVRMKIVVLIPQNLNIQYSDAGILIGNLLDNAIEACELISFQERWISIEMQYKKSKLIFKICNSKKAEKVNLNRSHKKNSIEHGLGIESVKSVINKYDGIIEFLDHGESFETSVILYGIKTRSVEA